MSSLKARELARRDLYHCGASLSGVAMQTDEAIGLLRSQREG
jgi:hypothetical protein